MLQARPSSATGMMSGQSQGHQYMGSGPVPAQGSRASSYGAPPSGYRGSSGPGQPRAFNNQQNLNHNLQWQQYTAYRTNSSPAIPAASQYDPNMPYRGHVLGNSASNMGYNYNFNVPANAARDDSSLSPRTPQQAAYYNVAGNAKPAPDRYRRVNAQAAQHNRSQSTNLPSNLNQPGGLYQLHNGSMSVPNLSGGMPGSTPASKDDMSVHHRASAEDRMRRRSMHSMDNMDMSKSGSSSYGVPERSGSPRLASGSNVHSRNGSSESVTSTRSSHSRPSSAHNRGVPAPTGNPSFRSADNSLSPKQEHAAPVSVPPRSTSADASKRAFSRSPLSKPATMASDSAEESLAGGAASGISNANLDTPAAKQLAALNQKGAKAKSKTSRLRRAFSFGSAADFRKATEDETAEKSEPAKLHKERSPEDAYDAEQARIAEAQEAAGIGNSIYGGRFFGSTDNLSISSTASSASVMIRKMGRGMKKSTRSLVGLFRPKSVIGVPAAEALAPEASQATVSMITVEAETQRVNVNPDPIATNGGTGFPHLERNSLDASRVSDAGPERLGSSGTEHSTPRKNIVGGDRERAEVLAAVRKGILKRPGSASPSIRPSDLSPEFTLPEIPAVADSPSSSAPSTPSDETHGHRRTGSIALGNEDYFMSALRLRQDTKSPPGTPSGNTKRSATFSPRIIFYDTWPSQEYDRRGDVATCNRLTPMLAQQIREEINSFKMEMEVHENSKIYTHFF
ncbi:bud neck involved protein [Lecanicillium sp. MT-2017a]|nr:bud neck involved protein [Lecanicillium sp. MT-2017a]